MRSITDHKVNGLNEAITITADGPGSGGASHCYTLFIPDSVPEVKPGITVHKMIGFQNGPIGEAGFNGLTNEALIAVVIDRLRGFQYGRKPDGTFDEAVRGKFACRENAIALTELESALMWLQKRTRDRIARGVEGTSKL